MRINLSLIKEKRLKKKYNINQMAEFLNLSNGSQYWKRENGDYNFKATELSVISEMLGIPFKDLFLSDGYSKTEINPKKEVS